MIALAVVLALGIVIALLLLAWRERGASGASGYFKSWRVLPALAGAGIAAAVGVATLRSASDVYRSGLSSCASVDKLLAFPKELVPKIPYPGSNLAVTSGTLWTKFVLVERAAEGVSPMAVWEAKLPCPASQGKPQKALLQCGPLNVQVDFNILNFWWERHDPKPRLVVQTMTSCRATLGDTHLEGMSSGFFNEQASSLGPFHFFPAPDRLFSLSKTAPNWYDLWFYADLEQDKGPVREMKLGELLASRQPNKDEPRVNFWNDAPYTGRYQRYTRSRAEVYASPGVTFAHRAGFASVALLGAAALLTVPFRRRAVAFALLLVLGVLYCAMLDRAVLGMHVRRLNDPKAALSVRMEAVRQLGETFFYARTASRALTQVAGAAATPELLKQAATHQAKRIEQDEIDELTAIDELIAER